jgi:MFS family permease
MKERYKILFLSSAILFSFYFTYDIPSALNFHLGPGDDARTNEYKVTLLYSVYALPNIVVPLFFGWIPYLKKSLLAQILCAFVFAGSLIFTLGVWRYSLRTMLLGRFLFGLGGESFAVIQNKLLSSEFKGKELSFAMGLFSSIARLGTVSNFVLTPILAGALGRMVPCIIGVVLTFIGLCICIRINSSGRSHELLRRKLISIQEKEAAAGTEPLGTIKKSIVLGPNNMSSFEYAMAGRNEFGVSLTNLNFAPIPSDNPFFTEYEPGPKSGSKGLNPVISENPFSPWQSRPATPRSRLESAVPKAIFEDSGTLFFEPTLEGQRSYHSAFFILLAISFLFALVWAPFYSIAPMLFQKRYGLGPISSGHMLAIIEGMSLVLVLITGTAADMYGHKLWFVAAGTTLLILGHLSIFLKASSPYFSIFLLGCAGPMISCYWPCIPSLVSEESLTTGFAAIYCVLNFAFTFSPVAVAFLVARDATYSTVELYLFSVGTIALFLVCLLSYVNHRQKLGLNDAQPVDAYIVEQLAD